MVMPAKRVGNGSLRHNGTALIDDKAGKETATIEQTGNRCRQKAT